MTFILLGCNFKLLKYYNLNILISILLTHHQVLRIIYITLILVCNILYLQSSPMSFIFPRPHWLLKVSHGKILAYKFSFQRQRHLQLNSFQVSFFSLDNQFKYLSPCYFTNHWRLYMPCLLGNPQECPIFCLASFLHNGLHMIENSWYTF